MQDEQTKAIAHIRSFNRFYTHTLGLLNRHILDSDFSLTEVRILMEIGKSPSSQSNAIADRLAIDRSFVSRILKRLMSKGLISKTPCGKDARAKDIAITSEGRAVLAEMDARSNTQIASLINGLSSTALCEIEQAMSLIRRQFSAALYPVRIRGYQPGDAQYIIHRHRDLYAQEYGLSSTFADYVDTLVTRFTSTLNPARECVLIPEMNGQRLGSIAIARADEQTAQLRFFLLEPQARGFGLGMRLAQEALAFARNAGYTHIFLETISALTSARAIYHRLGFRIVHTQPQNNWSREVLEERWEMAL